MKELVRTARNLFEIVDETSGARIPCVELVLTVSEPKLVINDGEIAQERELTDLRICLVPTAILILLKTLSEIAESMERLGMIKAEAEADAPKGESDDDY